MRVLSLFSGIGAFEKALRNMGIDYELVNYCEIDKHASKSFSQVHNVSEDLNLGDITKVDIESLPKGIDLVTHGSPCFTGETLVLTDSGYKPIKDVSVGDLVLDHTNSYNKVLRVLNQGTKEIWVIKTQACPKIRTTSNHRFYVRQKINGEFTNPEWKECQQLTDQDYIGISVHKDVKIPNIDTNLDLCDEALWFNIGNYLRVGERTGNKDFREFLNQFGQPKKTFGQTKRTRKLPRFVFDLPINYLQAILAGYISMENTTISSEGVEIKNIASEELAYGLGHIVAKVDKVPYSITKGLKGYILKFHRGRTDLYDSDMLWSPVESVIKTNTYETVYDLTVENSHSFTVYNHIAHNCTDFSAAGRQEGGDKGSGTRSSLMWNSVEIIKHCKPKYVIWENVKNVLAKKFIHNFEDYVSILEEFGYTTYYKVLNSKDYGIPQNRERIFAVSIRNDLNQSFQFPSPIPLEKSVFEFLDEVVDEKYYISLDDFPSKYRDKISEIACSEIGDFRYDTGVRVRKNKLCPTLTTQSGGGLSHSPLVFNPKLYEAFTSNTEDTTQVGIGYSPRCREYRGLKDLCPTLVARDYKDPKIVKLPNQELTIRKLTPTEYWRLMGFTDEDVEKCIQAKVSDTQLYKQAGNSITVPVLEEIFRELLRG